jgi:hypothetical protein
MSDDETDGFQTYEDAGYARTVDSDCRGLCGLIGCEGICCGLRLGLTDPKPAEASLSQLPDHTQQL